VAGIHEREKTMSHEQPQDVSKPGERQGGQSLGDAEAREKGSWAARADDGIGPAKREAEPGSAQEGELGASVVGATTGSDEPATEGGVDLSLGDDADATTDGGAKTVPGTEPDLKDAGSGPRRTDVMSADDVHRTAGGEG
jgi:hypothetical protein